MVELKSIERITNNVLRHFNNVMKSNGIEYILFAGTCLGFYRDKGYITKDTDIDIIIKFESDEQINKIIQIMTKSGFILSLKNPMTNELVLKKYGDVYSNLNFHHINYILIDIFFAYEIDEYYYVNNKWRFKKQLISELDYLRYNGILFKVPKNIEEYLDNIYIDWKTPTIRENCKDKNEWKGHRTWEIK